MSSSFSKSVHCPTNEALLAFLRANCDAATIGEHLAKCEFCELTLELLRAYPAAPVHTAPPAPPVPAPLTHLFATKLVNK